MIVSNSKNFHQFKIYLLNIGRLGNINITDCESCTPGYYCNGHGLSQPSGQCSAGYYCPGGDDTATPTNQACSPGHFCMVGSHNETGCPSGYYQPHWRKSDCDICPAGSYCKAFGMLFLSISYYNNIICLCNILVNRFAWVSLFELPFSTQPIENCLDPKLFDI